MYMGGCFGDEMVIQVRREACSRKADGRDILLLDLGSREVNGVEGRSERLEKLQVEVLQVLLVAIMWKRGRRTV